MQFNLLTGSHGPRQYLTLHWNITPYDSVNLNASYTDCKAFPSGPNDGNMPGSTGHLGRVKKKKILNVVKIQE